MRLATAEQQTLHQNSSFYEDPCVPCTPSHLSNCLNVQPSLEHNLIFLAFGGSLKLRIKLELLSDSKYNHQLQSN